MTLKNEMLQLTHIHPHWHLRTQGVNEHVDGQHPQILIEPAIVSAGRVGSRGHNSTRRDPSEFKLVEQSHNLIIIKVMEGAPTVSSQATTVRDALPQLPPVS
jgi:hypothetical protein